MKPNRGTRQWTFVTLVSAAAAILMSTIPSTSAAPEFSLDVLEKIRELTMFVERPEIDPASARLGAEEEIYKSNGSFVVDYRNDVFLLDGEPFNYVSGSVHYFRVPLPYWRHRLRMLRAAGFNAVQTYVAWNEIEPSQGIFRFDLQYDVETFLQIAQEEGLFVILRPGPYICAEYEAGGLPWWLLAQTPELKLRTSDPIYMRHVEDYFQVLLPKLVPFLYRNGGPILMVQVENEYGLYPACDGRYMEALRDLLRRHLGDDTVLFTTDPVEGLACGRVNGTLTTVDFGVLKDMKKPFDELRKFQPRGPLVNSEFYPGWFDLWSFPHAKVSPADTMRAFTQLLGNRTVSVNFYMFHGGTNFGFSAGGKTDPFGEFRPVPTSYDYDAPLSEAGDPTEKYFELQKVLNSSSSVGLRFNERGRIRSKRGAVDPPPKKAYGKVALSYKSSLYDSRYPLCTESLMFADPKSMEEIDQGYGFLLYEKIIDFLVCDPVVLHVPVIHDRGYVLVDGVLVGVLDRSHGVNSVAIYDLRLNSTLSILVENQGRIGFGPDIFDRKGILSQVFLTCGDKVNMTLQNWYHLPLPLNNTQFFYDSGRESRGVGSTNNPGFGLLPAFFEGELTISDTGGDGGGQSPADTFLRLDGFTKGVVVVNDVVLGRYWPTQGPQVTLYVPGTVLTAAKPNRVLVLELERAPGPCVTSSWASSSSSAGGCFVEFVDVPDIDGATPFGQGAVSAASVPAHPAKLRGWRTKT